MPGAIAPQLNKHYDSEENLKQYELEQQQRTLERRIRDTKRQTMGWREAVDKEKDPARRAEYESKYQQKAALLQKQNKAYNDFCKETGQKKRQERLQIAEWNRSQAAKARSAARKSEKSVDIFAENRGVGIAVNNKENSVFKAKNTKKDK